MRQMLSVIWLAGMGLVLVAAPASAGTGPVVECPIGSDMEQAVELAPVVFVGTVKEIDPKQSTAFVSVEEIWQGPELEPLVTVVSPGPAAGGVPFEVAQRYLFIPDGLGQPLFTTCPPVPFGEEVEALRPEEVTTPGSADDEEVAAASAIDLRPFAIPGLLVLGAAFSVVAFSMKGPSHV